MYWKQTKSGFFWTNGKSLLSSGERGEFDHLQLKFIAAILCNIYDKIMLSVNEKKNLECASWTTNRNCLGTSLSFPEKTIPKDTWQS